MEEINSVKNTADTYFNEGDFKSAYYEYDKVKLLLFSYLNETQLWRKLAKASGWVVALLTGGFGLEDIIIVPAVNKLLLKLFNIDINQLISHLNYAIRQKLVCLSLQDNFASTFEKTDVLNEFLLSYKLSEAEENSNDQLKSIFELVNPISDNGNLKSIENKKSLSEITDELLKSIEKNGPEIERLNSYLFSYLEKNKMIHSPLYVRLKSKGFTLS